MTRWELEYLLLFGPPENKLELLHGKTPCYFPFLDRDVADAHFAAWSAELARWQELTDPPERVADGPREKAFGGLVLQQYRRPIRLEVRSEWAVYEWASRSFSDRSLWPMQPTGFARGFDPAQDHWDIKHNLRRIFQEEKDRLGFEGVAMGGVDVSLTDRDDVQPDFFVFPGPRRKYLVGNEYFRGVPQMIVEVLSPFSRAIDRGPRKEVYRRAGVPELWLIEPLTRQIEVYHLTDGEYRLEASARPGDRLTVPRLGGLAIDADRVFDTQSRRFHGALESDNSSCNAAPTWAIPRDRVVGLEHLILLGHAERRREVWNNQSPCFLAFGSEEEASQRLDRFVLEAGRWKGVSAPRIVGVEPGMKAADVGPFHFIQQQNVVRLNVDVSGSLYRELLDVNAHREAWDFQPK